MDEQRPPSEERADVSQPRKEAADLDPLDVLEAKLKGTLAGLSLFDWVWQQARELDLLPKSRS